MLLVKDDIYIKKINRIMVAMDASETAKYCLKLALFLLKDLKGAELLLANINPDGQGKSGKAELTPEQNPILAVAIAEAKKYGVSTRCVVNTATSGQDGNITGSGRAGREICRLADDSNVDLLVIGSPDRRPSIAKNFVDLDRLLGSSLSDYVRVNATCPVLLARTDAA